MFKNYFLVAIRNLRRNKLYTGITIFGLSVSLAITLMVLGHINYELSFENFHKNRDKIYRVNGRFSSEDEDVYSARVMSPLGFEIKEQIPEVKSAAVFRMLGELNLVIGEEQFTKAENLNWAGFKHNGNMIAANSDFLDVFTLPLLAGDKETVLEEPFSIVISEKIVNEYFNGINPIGQSIRVNDQLNCQIKGIMRNVPENTQVHCDFLVSYSTLNKMGLHNSDWHNLNGDYAYLLLNGNADQGVVENKIQSLFSHNVSPEVAKNYQFELQPLKNIYFNVYVSGRRGELTPAGEISMILEIGIIALFILLLAIFNFINLSTARCISRLKEVGVRKVLGAYKNNLIRRFLAETIIITTISMLLSLCFYEIFLSLIRSNIPREMFASLTHTPLMLVSVLGTILVVGVFAGIYPALYLSKFKPVSIFQKRSESKSSKSILRKILVVFQFTIAIGFICCTVIILKQFNLITSMKLGFDRENVMLIDFDHETGARNCSVFKNIIITNPNVAKVTIQNCPPGRRSHTLYGFYSSPDAKYEDMFVSRTYFVDENFLDFYQLKLMQGRSFTSDLTTEENHSVIINKSAIEELGIENPIGHTFYRGNGKPYEIVGVVDDFHGTSLDFYYQPISTIILRPEKTTTLALKLQTDDIQSVISEVKETWETTFPNTSFIYSFLDDEISSNYNDIAAQWKIFGGIALFTIILACLGIFGLVSYASQQKIKEIGIRKVFGATIGNIVLMFNRGYIILILIANAIAWPLAYLGMSSFLSEFPFRAKIGFETFILTGLIILVLALVTTSFISYKAANGNLIKSLRNE